MRPRQRRRAQRPGRPAPGYQDVRMGESLLRPDVRCPGRDQPAVREPPEHVLVLGPEESRPHEGLVVEAGGQEAAGEAVGSLRVEPQRRPGVLRAHLDTGRHQPVSAADVGFIPDLDHAARVMVTGRQQAARPVVLQAPREHALAGGSQGRDDRVALERDERPAIPAESQLEAAVDDLARLRPKPHGHRRAWGSGVGPQREHGGSCGGRSIVRSAHRAAP